jgi:poly(3-hydroxybutyrate) depolymerase
MLRTKHCATSFIHVTQTKRHLMNPFRIAARLVASSSLVLSSTLLTHAQDDCDGYRYRYTGAFDEIDVEYDVPYGENINSNLVPEDLFLDIYSPVGDENMARPVVVIAHGGFFLAGSNDGVDVVQLCEDLAHMGYVVASMSYRLGIDDLFDLQTSFVEAVWRGVHDSRAAIRFFRKSMDFGNPYDVDTARIFLGGVSAGGFIALHHAYVDELSEIPSFIDQTEPGLGGGLAGLSGSVGYSDDVKAVFNIAGAIQTTDYMNLGDNEPVFSIHGTEDGTVPYGEGDIVYLGIPIIDVDGSAEVHAKADELGVDNCFITVEGADHVPHVWDPVYYDLTLSSLAGKLGEWSCDNYVPVCGEYDYTATTSVSDAPQVALPMVFPNPASTRSNVHVMFPASTDWRLVNAMGQTVSTGFSQAGSTETWRGLAEGWYVLKSNQGSTPLMVVR